MEKGWLGLPFRPISETYKTNFGGKVYKIPVTVVDDCPNRRGLKGMQTCVFCDVWGSAARTDSFTMSLEEQIETFHKKIGAKFKAHEFLVYFQAYTNTFTKLTALRENFQRAAQYPFVKGFVVGTRPDCLSKGVLDLWNEYSQQTYLGVELGVQSFFNDQLEFMKRGHTREQSLEALFKISAQTKADLGIHLMFGQPNETDEQIIETAEICSTLPITSVKLHNLHVLEKTPLADLYRQGEFTPIDLDTYTHRVHLFLQHLAPHIKIQRLAALSSRWDELIAPQWTRDKMGAHQYIVDHMRLQGSYQSQHYHATSASEIALQEELRLRSIPAHPELLESCKKNITAYADKLI